MYDKFGEFDTPEEINQAAAAQRQQGDEDALRLLARENGIDEEDAEDYYDGAIDALVNPATAAIGKLNVETADLRLGGVLLDWIAELRDMCVKSEDFARAVRRKGKDLAGYMAIIVDEGYENRTIVDQRIINKTRQVKKIIRNNPLAIGIPDKRTRRQLAEQYYTGKKG